MKKCLGLLFVIIFSLSSCYYDSEEDLYGSVICNTTNVSFASDVNPILVNHCVSCHFKGSSIGGGINLDGYTAAVTYPKDQNKLDDCKISKIEAWVKAGSPDN
jgi:hypothetical protein